MCRYAFYIAIALLAFGVGSAVVFTSYLATKEKLAVKKENKTTSENKSEKPIGIGYGIGEGLADLDKTDNTPKLYKATCNNKFLLPIWNELRKDREFKSREDEFYQTGDCSDLIEIDRIDLNGDGQKEFIVWGRYTFSGATGSSVIWIYEKRNGKYKQLLQDYAFYGDSKWFEVKRSKTKGYRNLLLKGHFTAAETTHSFFKFNGSKYVETKCWFEIYSMNEEKPHFMTCQEYSENTEKELRESEERLKNQ